MHIKIHIKIHIILSRKMTYIGIWMEIKLSSRLLIVRSVCCMKIEARASNLQISNKPRIFTSMRFPQKRLWDRWDENVIACEAPWEVRPLENTETANAKGHTNERTRSKWKSKAKSKAKNGIQFLLGESAGGGLGESPGAKNGAPPLDIE